MEVKKIILDACCGGRMFWFDKKNPNTLFVDNRIAKKGHRKHRLNHSVEPDNCRDEEAYLNRDKKLISELK